MSRRKPERPAGGFRAPSTNGDPAPQRRGLLEGLFAPRHAGATSMPRITSSVARGFVAVVSSPAVIFAIPVVVLVEWLAAILLGFQGPFTLFASALAMPPIGTLFDSALATGIFGQRLGLELVLAFVAVRALILAMFVAAVTQILEDDHVTSSTIRRGLRAVPTTLAVGIASMIFVTFASVVASFLGLGIGTLVYLGGLVFAVYLLSFAPVMAAAERRSMPESMSRSIRAGRLPGAGNLAFAALYVVVSFVALEASGRSFHLGVNPSAAEWAFVLLANLLQVTFLATFAFRYLSITDEVPAAPAPRQRSSRRR